MMHFATDVATLERIGMNNRPINSHFATIKEYTMHRAPMPSPDSEPTEDDDAVPEPGNPTPDDQPVPDHNPS